MADWNELFLQQEFRWQHPAMSVIQFIASLPSQEFQDKAILDLGCGAGRHCHYFARLGFKTFGTDISENGLQAALERLRGDNLNAILVKSDMTVIPFENGFFDYIVSTHVIHHNTREAIDQCLAEIHRALKPGGQVFLILLSSRDSRYGLGQQLEPHTYALADGPEAGVPHHFFPREELEAAVRDFTVLNLVHEIRDILVAEGASCQRTQAHWCVTLEKKLRP